MRNTQIDANPAGWVIAIGVFYILMAISLVSHTHDHDHDHGIIGVSDCSACFYTANHLGIELPVFEFTNLNIHVSIYSPVDFIYISTTPISNIHSRAPPV